MKRKEEEKEILAQMDEAMKEEKKKAVIEKYSKKLDEATIQKFNEDIENYTITDLEKELAFSLVNNATSIFGAEEGSGIVPTNLNPTGIEAILAKHSK